jgi:hypothetical protein
VYQESEVTTMRFDHESLGKIRGVILAIVGALILIAYVVSRLRG